MLINFTCLIFFFYHLLMFWISSLLVFISNFFSSMIRIRIMVQHGTYFFSFLILTPEGTEIAKNNIYIYIYIYMKSSSTVGFDHTSHWSYCKIPFPRYINFLKDFSISHLHLAMFHPLNRGRSSLLPNLVIERKVLLLIN